MHWTEGILGRVRGNRLVPVPWGPAYGLARTFLALSIAATMLSNSAGTLFHPVAGMGELPRCDGINAMGLFCLVPRSQFDLWLVVAAVALLLVATGWRPRLTSIPLAWLCFSFHSAISIPDGGDQISLVLGLLLLPVGLTDPRTWHWSRWNAVTGERGALSRASVLLAVTMLILARLQVCAVYFQASIAKLAVPEWADGTALYYWINSVTFGAPGWLRPVLSPLVDIPVGVAVLTWSPMVLEFALAVSVLRPSRRLRAVLLPMGVGFHVAIAVTMGLWSFCAAMVAALLLLLVPVGGAVADLYPKTGALRPRRVVPDADMDGRSEPPEERGDGDAEGLTKLSSHR